MNNTIKLFSLATTAVITLSGAMGANADANVALKGCKADIAQDHRLEGQDIIARMDKMKARGRYVSFSIDVEATDSAGNGSDWVATCKASRTGKVETLELARVNQESEISVAQTD